MMMGKDLMALPAPSQHSQNAANEAVEPSAMERKQGDLVPASLTHSNHPSAGTRQGRDLNALWKAGFESTVSARELINREPIFASLARNRIRPQRRREIEWAPSASPFGQHLPTSVAESLERAVRLRQYTSETDEATTRALDTITNCTVAP